MLSSNKHGANQYECQEHEEFLYNIHFQTM